MSATDRVAVVTGAGGGIGRAISARMAALGWRVVGVDSVAPAGDGSGLEWLRADVRDPSTLVHALACARELGALHAWVNNAGIGVEAPLHAVGAEDVKAMLDVNLLAVIDGCRLAIGEFLEAGRPGSVLNISSVHARASFPGSPVYDATKAAVEALTRQLCIDYGHRRIRVNAIAPGAVMSPATARTLERAVDPERLARTWRSLSPSRRILDPDEIASAAAFLLSDEAEAINGHVLAVDGGMTAGFAALPFVGEVAG